jgi:hypothetical protein
VLGNQLKAAQSGCFYDPYRIRGHSQPRGWPQAPFPDKRKDPERRFDGRHQVVAFSLPGGQLP